MEASSARGGSLLASPSQPPRKEWRAVSESSYRTSVSEETERGSLGQSDERTIYEEGADGEFCSITVDGIGGLSDELLQQRLQIVVQQREELMNFEIELKSQAIARPRILEAQNNLDGQLKEHVSATAKLKEQLIEREKYIREIEKKLEDKDGEVRALQIDNETGWPKDDLLREQNKELATFRRERDNSEAERAQHVNQIRDLQELVREKENQLLSLEEQHRATQETMLFKEEQLREAHTWISRVQEMDVLNNSNTQTLQNELRERTDQFYQYWMGLQRQYAEMERHHLQIIQQLQLELAVYKDGTQDNVSDQTKLNHANGNNNTLSNGNIDVSKKGEHVQQVQSPSLMGVGPSYIAPPQLAYMMQLSQGVPTQSIPPTNSIQLGSFQPIPAIIPGMPEVMQMPNQIKFEADLSLLRQNNVQNQVDLSNNKPIENSQGIEQKSSTKGSIQIDSANSNYTSVQSSAVANNSQMQELNNSNTNKSAAETDKNGMNYSEIQNNSIKGQEMPIQIPLLDERSILACIVRSIPPGPTNHIKISTNLPNRLAKMLAPLTWHDYRNHYGNLEDFVSRHPELFVIEGDFIRVREGAQQIISATTAAARMAAASSYSSPFMPPVAVTPVARQKRSQDMQQVSFVNNTNGVIQGIADVRLSTNGSSNGVGNSNVRQQSFAPKHTARTTGTPAIARR